MDVLYIYYKDKKHIVLNQKEAEKQHYVLIEMGFYHQSTIDPIKYIENFLNNTL